MMEPGSGAARYEEAASRLAQFEPDPDGLGIVEVIFEATGPDGDAAAWVTFEDADGERSWASDELVHLTVSSFLEL